MQLIDQAVIGLNNLTVKGRRAKVQPEELLILLPTCLQAASCEQNVIGDLAHCLRCGRCRIGPLLDLAERYGVKVAVAKGGRVAVSRAKAPEVNAIVAVACEKELRTGIFACLPKPVLAVTNQRPNGPCCETDVDIDAVEQAIQWLTRTS